MPYFLAVVQDTVVAEGATAVEAIKRAEQMGYHRQDIYVQQVNEEARV